MIPKNLRRTANNPLQNSFRFRTKLNVFYRFFWYRHLYFIASSLRRNPFVGISFCIEKKLLKQSTFICCIIHQIAVMVLLFKQSC